MDDWYKKYFDTASATFDAVSQIAKMEKLHGSSFEQMQKDFLSHEELIKNSTMFGGSSCTEALLGFQSKLDKFQELHLFSNASINSIGQASSDLIALASGQNSFAEIIKNAGSINRSWEEQIEFQKYLAGEADAAKLALGSHFDEMARSSLLAQKILLDSSWNDLENNTLYNANEITTALDSFEGLTNNYNSLIHSFSSREFNVLDFPPFVSNLPQVEILTSSALLNKISNVETKQSVEQANIIEPEIREDIENSLEELINLVNPQIKQLLLGAKEALDSKNPDKKRHIVVSLREMLTHILNSIAPDKEVASWTSESSHFHNNRPTREARLLYICREINHGPFVQFVSKDVESHIKFIRLFQRGTHKIEIDFTNQQLETLIIRSEALVRFLLITWKNTR